MILRRACRPTCRRRAAGGTSTGQSRLAVAGRARWHGVAAGSGPGQHAVEDAIDFGELLGEAWNCMSIDIGIVAGAAGAQVDFVVADVVGAEGRSDVKRHGRRYGRWLPVRHPARGARHYSASSLSKDRASRSTVWPSIASALAIACAARCRRRRQSRASSRLAGGSRRRL